MPRSTTAVAILAAVLSVPSFAQQAGAPQYTISTIAGTGVQGYSGDGGSTTKAMLNGPFGIAVDAAENIYFSDVGNNRIRKITPDGTITTVVGIGVQGYGGVGGAAINAKISNPAGVALDSSGNLYIGDVGNSRIRKVTNGIITTIAGNGTAGFSGDGGIATSAEINTPQDVFPDNAGNLYIADTRNNRIRKV